MTGWSVGHVITHVARNADSHTRRVEAAKRDEIVDQYAGGYEGRAAEIEIGAGRSAAELVQDVTESAELLEESWGSLSKVVWAREVSDVAGRTHLLSNMPSRRWRELEIHLVDLDIGPTWRDWPDEFVSLNLPLLRLTLEKTTSSRFGGSRPRRARRACVAHWPAQTCQICRSCYRGTESGMSGEEDQWNPRRGDPTCPDTASHRLKTEADLLPWAWAVERIIASHYFWLSTVRPNGRPHAMPVWGVWTEEQLWFSSSSGSRKALNLESNPWAVNHH